MADDRNRIVVRSAAAEGCVVRYEVEYGSRAGRYFSEEPFYVEYDRDVGGVPEGVLAIPLLANLCPVAWAIGADVHVGKLDREFYDSLLAVKEQFAALYPRLRLRGELRVGELTDDRPAEEPLRTAAFFSGGVDSLATFLRRKEENPYLVTIWGGDIGLGQSELWREVKRRNADFAHRHGLDILFVKSSLRTFLNEERIAFEFGRFTHGWWPGLQHGIGMVGLTAPLAYALGIKRLHVPSALPPALKDVIPDGSNTRINNRLRWAGAAAALDGEELSRQDKVGLIADFVAGTGERPVVRVCWSSGRYGNCCRCEKCLRTVAALLAEGADPRELGFPVGEETLPLLREKLPAWLPGSRLRLLYWTDIRDRFEANLPQLSSEGMLWLDWLSGLDFPKYRRKRSLVHALASGIPHPVFLLLKRAIN